MWSLLYVKLYTSILVFCLFTSNNDFIIFLKKDISRLW